MAVGKRKREALPDEVEVDITAPEPPSKKELRRAKKGKPVNHKPANSDDEADPVAKAARKAVSKNQATHRELDQAFQEADSDADSDSDEADAAEDDENESEITDRQKSGTKAKDDAEAARKDAPGVWIGNLPWTVTKNDLLKFVTEKGKILPTDVTRVHMPGPMTAAVASAAARHKKLTNRGFAYLDFKTDEIRDLVIELSENLLSGRAVLIKNSKSYEGRPAKEEAKGLDSNGKPPSQRIFVGNLSFDATEDDLRDHFAKCGLVKSVFIATFPDSGNCKGYAWVTFEELVSAEKAIRGWVELAPEDIPAEEGNEEDTAEAKDGDEEGDETEAKTVSQARKERRKKKAKPRKWFVNRLKGRELRMEYAEDATTRYVKRFGKKKDEAGTPAVAGEITPPENVRAEYGARKARTNLKPSSHHFKTDGIPDEKLAFSKPRREADKDTAYKTGAMVAGKGKKVTF